MTYERSSELRKMKPGTKVRFDTGNLSRLEIKTMMGDYGVNDRVIKGIMEILKEDPSYVFTVHHNRSSESLQLEEFRDYHNKNIRRSMFVLVTRESEILAEAEEL